MNAPKAAPIRDPRHAAIAAVIEWERFRSRFMDQILGRVLDAADLDARDRRFATELVYGYVRRVNTLEAIEGFLAGRPYGEIDTPIRAALGIGLYQLLYLETPAHAAVDATLSAFREFSNGSRLVGSKVDRYVGMVNAVLRRAGREIQVVGLEEANPEDPNVLRGDRGWIRVQGFELPSRDRHLHARLAIQYSHPQEMVRVWSERYPEDVLVQMMVRNNERPKTHLALRQDGPSVEAFLASLEAAGHKAHAAEVERTITLDSPAAIATLPGYDEGHFWVQDLTARSLTLMLPPPEAGQKSSLLDLCAAPGGKLSTLLDRDNYPSALACDVDEKRLRRVAENLERLRFDVKRIDVSELPEDPDQIRLPKDFDRITIDVPCSNTGVLHRRHEARWRFVPENIRPIVQKQKALLKAGLRHLSRGGFLLYTTCSIEPDENSGVIHDVLRGNPEIQLIEEREVLPGEAGGDGGYGALITRRRG